MQLTKDEIIIQLRNIEKMAIDYQFEHQGFVPNITNGEFHLDAISYAIAALENPEIDLQSSVTVDNITYHVFSVCASNSFDRGREITIKGSEFPPEKPINSFDLVRAYCEKEGLNDMQIEGDDQNG